MSSTKTRGNTPQQTERYPLGIFPKEVIVSVGKQIIHRLAVGVADITGDDFGDIFSKAIDGMHAKKPEGVADVTWNRCAWSVKTIKSKDPFSTKKVRLISGRNSPIYSHGITEPLADIQKTGNSVLSVWNKRVGQARYNSDNIRRVVLIRSIERLEFVIYEVEVGQYQSNNYEWELNNKRNLEGTEKATGWHSFTWQPHGSQFTIIEKVPASGVKFKLRRPSVIEDSQVLRAVGYNDDWVSIVEK